MFVFVALAGKTDNGPLGVYKSKVEGGELQWDSHQQKVVERLQILHQELSTYNPDQHTESWLAKVKPCICYLDTLLLLILSIPSSG